jgi:hypothetical protein
MARDLACFRDAADDLEGHTLPAHTRPVNARMHRVITWCSVRKKIIKQPLRELAFTSHSAEFAVATFQG